MLNEIQVRLFNAVTQKFKNRAKAIDDYRKRYSGTSESTARARFTGINSISYTHGMEVAAAYHLHDLDIWPEGWSGSDFYAQSLVQGTGIDTYLNMLIHDFKQVQKLPQARLRLTIHNIPFTILSQYRTLAAFSLYFSLCFELNDEHFRRQKLGKAFMQHSKVAHWLDLCCQALAVYQAIPGVEYWSPYMLQPLVHKIRLVQRMGLFEDNEMVHWLKDDLQQLIGDLEQNAQTGKKCLGPAQYGAPVQIFNHEGVLPDTLIIAETADETTLFCYEERGLAHLMRFDVNMSSQKQRYVVRAGRVGGELGTAIDSQFFSRLHQSIMDL